MEKSDVLREMQLEELIGTAIEDEVTIKRYKKGDIIFYDYGKDIPCEYLIEGQLQYTIYSPEGGEFYAELFPGNLAGINGNLSNNRRLKFKRSFEAEKVVVKDSLIAEIPLHRVFDMTFEGKEKVLEKIIMLTVEESMKRSKYFLYKTVCSDEEFFLKSLEIGKINNLTTKEVSRILNINLRTMQRIIKVLTDKEIIRKENKGFVIADKERLDDYKVKFEK